MIQKHRCSQQSGFCPKSPCPKKPQRSCSAQKRMVAFFSENWAVSLVAFSSEKWAVSPVAFSSENWAMSPVSFSSENGHVTGVFFFRKLAVSPLFLLWTEGRVVCAQRSFQVWCQHCPKTGLCAHTAATTVDFLTESDALTHCVHHALLFATSSSFHK